MSDALNHVLFVGALWPSVPILSSLDCVVWIIITALKIASTPTPLCLLGTCLAKPQHWITPTLHQTVEAQYGEIFGFFHERPQI